MRASDYRFLEKLTDARIIVMTDLGGRQCLFHAVEPFATDFRIALEGVGFVFCGMIRAVTNPTPEKVIEVQVKPGADWTAWTDADAVALRGALP